jgi:hypothetical protein
MENPPPSSSPLPSPSSGPDRADGGEPASRRAVGWVGGSLSLTDDLLRPPFGSEDDLPIPVTAPPLDGRPATGDADTAEFPIVRRRSPVPPAGLLVAVLLLVGTGIALAVTDRGTRPDGSATAPGFRSASCSPPRGGTTAATASIWTRSPGCRR